MATKYLDSGGLAYFWEKIKAYGNAHWSGGGGGSFEVGFVQMFAGYNVPAGWLMCSGQEVAISDYPDLYAVVGTIYGTASDSDHFKLPDFRGRMPIGSGLGTAEDATNRVMGTMGGSERVTLEANQSGVPAHSHGMTHTHSHSHVASGYKSSNAASGTARQTPISRTATDRSGTYTTDTDATASSKSVTDSNEGQKATESHANMPPYVAVNYIIYAGA